MSTSDGPFPLAGNTSTWDDWLVMRGRPEPGPGETGVTISTADGLASQIQYGLYDCIDLSMAHVRDGVRELFDEFERDTEGQHMQWRDMTKMRRELYWEQCAVGHDEGGNVTLVLSSSTQVQHIARMSTDQAKDLATALLQEVDALGDLGPDD